MTASILSINAKKLFLHIVEVVKLHSVNNFSSPTTTHLFLCLHRCSSNRRAHGHCYSSWRRRQFFLLVRKCLYSHRSVMTEGGSSVAYIPKMLIVCCDLYKIIFHHWCIFFPNQMVILLCSLESERKSLLISFTCIAKNSILIHFRVETADQDDPLTKVHAKSYILGTPLAYYCA